MVTRYLFSFTLLAVLTSQAFAEDGSHKAMEGATLNPLEKTKWVDGPPSLPKGAKIAVLEGDPAKEGPFVFRVKVPDGYRIPLHTHPKMERVTVIAGTFYIGMGDEFDVDAAEAMPTGTYGYWPPGMKHFVYVKGETIAQFHGDGPWVINYVNPEEDPRHKPKRTEVEFTEDSVEVVKNNLADEKAILVDVRSQEEWNQGHLEGSLFLPVTSLRKHSLDKKKLADSLPKDKILYTFCVVGMRAKEAAKVLTAQGYEVRALDRGYDDLVKAGFK